MSKQQGIKPEDEKKLKELIAENRKFVEYLSSIYLLKDDLIEVKNRSYGATKLIQVEIDNLKKEILETISEKDKLLQQLTNLSKLNAQIEKFINLVEETHTSKDILLIDYIEEILNQDKVDEIEQYEEEIRNFYEKIYGNNDTISISTQVSDFISNMNNAQKFLTETVEFQGVPVAKKDVIKKQYEEIINYYHYLFDDNEENSIKTDLEQKIEDLSKFHHKIFGDERTISLKDDLDKRLKELKEVEEEAKKVINLASDAGLAGGFVEKAKDAKKNKERAVIILVSSLILIALFNFWNIDFKKLEEITIVSIIVRATINLPLLWLAIVANINLNKYSRLEQDYAHKEALAKSYERYKTEISKLSDEDDQAENLKLELIKINLEAFKLNPADNMDRVKNDSFLDKFFVMKYLNQQNQNDAKNEKEHESS